MDDGKTALVNAELDCLTKTGLAARLFFVSFVIAMATITGFVLYATAITSSYAKQVMGVDE